MWEGESEALVVADRVVFLFSLRLGEANALTLVSLVVQRWSVVCAPSRDRRRGGA